VANNSYFIDNDFPDHGYYDEYDFEQEPSGVTKFPFRHSVRGRAGFVQTVRFFENDQQAAATAALMFPRATMMSPRVEEFSFDLFDAIAKQKLISSGFRAVRSGATEYTVGSLAHGHESRNTDSIKHRAKLSYESGSVLELSYRSGEHLRIKRGLVVKLYDDGLLLRSPYGYRRYSYERLHAAMCYAGELEKSLRELEVTLDYRRGGLGELTVRDISPDIDTFAKAVDTYERDGKVKPKVRNGNWFTRRLRKTGD